MIEPRNDRIVGADVLKMTEGKIVVMYGPVTSSPPGSKSLVCRQEETLGTREYCTTPLRNCAGTIKLARDGRAVFGVSHSTGEVGELESPGTPWREGETNR